MIMTTSSLAEKSVVMKIKIIMNFMNEIINPTCNSLLAKLFEAIRKVCPKQCHLPCGDQLVPSGQKISC